MINFHPISNVLGALLALLGTIMFILGVGYSIVDSHSFVSFAIPGGVTVVFGLLLWFIKFGDKRDVNKREGYLIVALAWIFMTIFGALPYIFSGVTGSSFVDALFEAVSGFTTTGATIFTDIEALPDSILLWRSLTQWIGGMGIIVLTVALLPLLGIGGIQLFAAEAPGPTSDKIHPRIQETAKRLYYIYVGLTLVLMLVLYLEGMKPFDAINHALTTMATGGFSTKNASMAYFDSPLIQYTVAIFMIFAGTNYSMLYFGLKFRFNTVWKNEEFRFYLLMLSIFTLMITGGILYSSDGNLESSFRAGLFQVASLITTTGYITDDYTAYNPFVTCLCFVLLFIGACAGSTSGGIKLIRHLALIKNSYLEFKRLLHPRSIIRVKMNGMIVNPKILTHILVFLLVYLATFVFGTIIVSIWEKDLITSASAVATSIGNVGPGLGVVGPVDNFASLKDVTKAFLSFLMILGRLELFTILVIFTPFFWRHN